MVSENFLVFLPRQGVFCKFFLNTCVLAAFVFLHGRVPVLKDPVGFPNWFRLNSAFSG